MSFIEGSRREDVGLLGYVFLQDVVLNGAAKLVPGHALFLSDDEIHRPQNRRWSVGRHGRADSIKRYSIKQRFHIGERIDGHAALADFACRHRMIRVVAHQCRKMKCNREARLPLLEEIPIAAIRFFGRTEAAELAHRPEFFPDTSFRGFRGV
jgi:hypothetical protein